jgi:CRISPR-associated protein Csd1
MRPLCFGPSVIQTLRRAAADIFGDNPKTTQTAVKALCRHCWRRCTVASGVLLMKTHAFMSLGLAPNAARISIRFYHCVTLGELGQRIAQHFEDLSLARGPHDPEYPSLFRLLAACGPAGQGRQHSAQPGRGHHAGDLSGNTPVSPTWLNAAVLRCRAEQNVTYLRLRPSRPASIVCNPLSTDHQSLEQGVFAHA